MAEQVYNKRNARPVQRARGAANDDDGRHSLHPSGQLAGRVTLNWCLTEAGDDEQRGADFRDFVSDFR